MCSLEELPLWPNSLAHIWCLFCLVKPATTIIKGGESLSFSWWTTHGSWTGNIWSSCQSHFPTLEVLMTTSHLYPLIPLSTVNFLANILKLMVTRKGCLSAPLGTIQKEGIVVHLSTGAWCRRQVLTISDQKKRREEEQGTNNYQNLPCARHMLSHCIPK